MRGILKKMFTELGEPVQYQLPIGDHAFPLNDCLGEKLKLTYTGSISCVYCARKSSKSFGQGYCYPCFKKLARCDMCIIKPEQCHYAKGTCREPEWGEANCMRDHYVYLANSSGIKVGITRETQIPHRWIDQGAIQAVPILKVASRHLSGLVEILFAEKIPDKTNWQAMLKGQNERLNMEGFRDQLLEQCSADIVQLQEQFGTEKLTILTADQAINIEYPVLEYPKKIKSLNFDKEAEINAVLKGIKGQYLIFDTGVINIRKYSGYEIDLAS